MRFVTFRSLISATGILLFWKETDFASSLFLGVTHPDFFYRLRAIVTENNFNATVILVTTQWVIFLWL